MRPSSFGLLRALGNSTSLYRSRAGLPEVQRRCLRILPNAQLRNSKDKTFNSEQLEAKLDQRERVVVLGSGWAGFTIARGLDPKKFQVVVVSPRSYFAFTPLLASTAVGTLEFRTALEPIRKAQKGITYLQGWADAVNFDNKVLSVEESVDDPTQAQAPTRDPSSVRATAEYIKERADMAKKGKIFNLRYDKLIVAVGSYSQTFGTPGVREMAFFLKDVGDARRIRNRLLECFELASLPTTTEQMKKYLLNFAVVGGGPTGIEFSAELHDIITEDLSKLYPDLMKYYNITVYDVAPKVLPMFDEKLGKYAMERFSREGIKIKTQHHVQELRLGPPTDVEMKDDHLCYTLNVKEEGDIGIGMCVWSTGLMANPFLENGLDAKMSIPTYSAESNSPSEASNENWIVKRGAKTGSILTDNHLRVLTVPAESDGSLSKALAMADVFALGDCAMTIGTKWPATAQVANQKASWLVKRLNKGDLHAVEGFHWKNMGVMAYIGNWNALLQSEQGSVSGKTAWFIWRGAYLTKSMSIRNKILIPIYWFINWVFGRDITRF